MTKEEITDMVKLALDSELEDAQYTYNDFSSQGLTFGSIEAEGYLRAVKTVRNEIYSLLDIQHD